MTNTGDFRRYSYGSDAAYAVQAFNYQRTSAAPAYIPKPEKECKAKRAAKEQGSTCSRAKTQFKKGFKHCNSGGIVPFYAFCRSLYQCKNK